MDFGKVKRPVRAKASVNPIELFEKLPSLPNTPNDLWRGQTAALEDWHANRNQRDILISLNTGAGKTLVGLLIAQSLVNEGAQDVLYLCSTIDLVYQTRKEAERLGIPCSVRVKGDFDNNLFKTGKGFCITTYSSVFNSMSHILNNYRPKAVIFDDAHVAEKIIRDSYTLTIKSAQYPQLYQELTGIFEDVFETMGRMSTYKDVLDGTQPSTVIQVPPSAVFRKQQQIEEIVRRSGINEDSSEKFGYRYLQDNLAKCAFLVASNSIEISPPFLPVLTHPLVEATDVRRVYLSASLSNVADFARAFGRIPNTIIEPKNDAGNGERLILFGEYLEGGEVSHNLLRTIAASHKALIAVSSYAKSAAWSDFNSPPNREQFSECLDEFRQAETGTFVLVSRVDGIDLPHDTCRVMVVDGLPVGQTLIEKYQVESLKMANLHSSKMSNRIVQLLGRINRGRNDYGVFLVNGDDVNQWLMHQRNLALLPELIQKQVLLGQYLHEENGLNDSDAVVEVISQVINRDSNWLQFYSDTIDNLDVSAEESARASEIQEKAKIAALAETTFIASLWSGEYAEAVNVLEDQIESLARSDNRLAGWHNLWLGLALEYGGDKEAAAQEYRRAKRRVTELKLENSKSYDQSGNQSDPASPFVSSILDIAHTESKEAFSKEIRKISETLSYLTGEGTTNQKEEAVRTLGELLGYQSTRPDNDQETGPDVLWIDADKNLLGFELKTEKNDPATYYKKDIAQGHDHLQWIQRKYGDHHLQGMVYVGPTGVVENKANPSDLMYLMPLNELAELANFLVAGLKDVNAALPIERGTAAQTLCANSRFTLSGGLASLFSKLSKENLAEK